MIAFILIAATIFSSDSKMQVVMNSDRAYGFQRSGDKLNLMKIDGNGNVSIIQSAKVNDLFDYPKPSTSCSGNYCTALYLGASKEKDSVELIKVTYLLPNGTPIVEQFKLTSSERYIKAGITGDIWLISGENLGAVLGGCYFEGNRHTCYDKGLIRIADGSFMGKDETGKRFIVSFASGGAKYPIPDSLGARDVRDVIANKDSAEILTSRCVISLPSVISKECLVGDWRYAYDGHNGTKLMALNLMRDSIMLYDRISQQRDYYQVPKHVVSVLYRNGSFGAISKDSILIFSRDRIVRKANRCREGNVSIRIDGGLGVIQCESTGKYEIIKINE